MKYGITHIKGGDYKLYYRFIWSTGYNRPLLNETIASELEEIIRSVGEQKRFQVIEFHVCESYYVDCIVSAHPAVCVSDMLSWMKGISARKIDLAHPDLKYKCYHGKLWNRSYYAESIGAHSKTAVKRYLQNQERGRKPVTDLETGENLPTWIEKLYEPREVIDLEEKA